VRVVVLLTHVGENINTYRILVGKSKGEKPFKRSRRRRPYHINIDSKVQQNSTYPD
jgi:hypothetical protein